MLGRKRGVHVDIIGYPYPNFSFLGVIRTNRMQVPYIWRGLPPINFM